MQDSTSFDATDWYWIATDGRIFASARCIVVAAGDAGYAAFLAAGNVASAWPVDGTGAQTMDALGDMLAHYGLATTMAATLIADASAKQLALLAAGITVNIGTAAAPVDAIVATDAAGIGRVTANIQMIGLAAALGKPAPTFRWNNGGGVSLPINVAQMQTISWAMNSFLQATENTVDDLATAIADGVVTAAAQIDAPPAPIAWPATSY